MNVFLEETGSTNNYAKLHVGELGHGDYVSARWQSAGRGQRGNSWESEAGSNVMMSIVLRPDGLAAVESFRWSEAVAVGVVRSIVGLVGGGRVAVKWPNDIYVGDRKIAGILIENSLRGSLVESMIAGIGLNVNQREFLSDAPNPVSIVQLSGVVNDVAELTDSIAREVVAAVGEDMEGLHREYMSLLWRGSGEWEFEDRASGERFLASVVDVAPSGRITLRRSDGRSVGYYFKEIAWVCGANRCL